MTRSIVRFCSVILALTPTIWRPVYTYVCFPIFILFPSIPRRPLCGQERRLAVFMTSVVFYGFRRERCFQNLRICDLLVSRLKRDPSACSPKKRVSLNDCSLSSSLDLVCFSVHGNPHTLYSMLTIPALELLPHQLFPSNHEVLHACNCRCGPRRRRRGILGCWTRPFLRCPSGQCCPFTKWTRNVCVLRVMLEDDNGGCQFLRPKSRAHENSTCAGLEFSRDDPIDM